MLKMPTLQSEFRKFRFSMLIRNTKCNFTVLGAWTEKIHKERDLLCGDQSRQDNITHILYVEVRTNAAKFESKFKYSSNAILKKCRKEIIKSEQNDYGWFGQRKKAADKMRLNYKIWKYNQYQNIIVKMVNSVKISGGRIVTRYPEFAMMIRPLQNIDKKMQDRQKKREKKCGVELRSSQKSRG